MDNIIRIGKKANVVYVLSVMTQFSSGVKEVIVKARGRNISKAVDVVEMVRNKYKKVDLKVTIGTDSFDDKKLSTIEIRLVPCQ